MVISLDYSDLYKCAESRLRLPFPITVIGGKNMMFITKIDSKIND